MVELQPFWILKTYYVIVGLGEGGCYTEVLQGPTRLFLAQLAEIFIQAGQMLCLCVWMLIRG